MLGVWGHGGAEDRRTGAGGLGEGGAPTGVLGTELGGPGRHRPSDLSGPRVTPCPRRGVSPWPPRTTWGRWGGCTRGAARARCHVPQAAAPCSTAPWAPRCCCHAQPQQGGQPSGAGGELSWEHILHRGWPSPTPAWPTRATTAATTLAPARPGPLSACGWAVSDPGPPQAPRCWLGVPGEAGSGVTTVPCPRPPPTAHRRVLGHQLPAGSELLLGPGP